MHYIKLLRVKEWAKNSFLFLPLFFAGDIFNPDALLRLLVGFVAFSFIASSIYILNDYRDREADSQHPEKKNRPLASGKVKPGTGLAIMIVLALLAMVISYALNMNYFIIILIYFGLNIFYSLGLKNIAILDLYIIAAGFILRVKGGGAITEVVVSHWLIIMIFLLAIFLGLAKRRDDILIKLASGKEMRKAIKKYNLDFINASIVMVSAITVVAYLMYTLTPEVHERFSYRIYYTTLFVVAGLMRYLQLVYVENKTGSPTKILLKDRFVQITILLWLASFYLLIYVRDMKFFL